MKTYSKLLIAFSFVFVISSAFLLTRPPWKKTSYSSEALSICMVADGAQVGDYNQVLGVLCALKNLSSLPLSVKKFSFAEEKKLKEQFLSTSPPRLVLTVGEKGADLILKIHQEQWPLFPKTRLCHLSHQMTEKHSGLVGKAHLLAIPSHSTPSDFHQHLKQNKNPIQTDLIETIGVAHNVTPQEIQKAYEKNQMLFPQAVFTAKHLIAIILPGDAANPDGSVQIYTENSARALARYLHTSSKEKRYFLILNGPRTGKYDPITHKPREASKLYDPVTQVFVEELEKQGLKQDEGFSVFPFKPGQPSPYKPVLGLIREANASILVPGESISMISECVDNLPAKNITIYTHEAMNEGHHLHASKRQELGQANLMPWKEEQASLFVAAPKELSCFQRIKKECLKRLGKQDKPAAQAIATKILELS